MGKKPKHLRFWYRFKRDWKLYRGEERPYTGSITSFEQMVDDMFQSWDEGSIYRKVHAGLNLYSTGRIRSTSGPQFTLEYRWRLFVNPQSAFWGPGFTLQFRPFSFLIQIPLFGKKEAIRFFINGFGKLMLTTNIRKWRVIELWQVHKEYAYNPKNGIFQKTIP